MCGTCAKLRDSGVPREEWPKHTMGFGYSDKKAAALKLEKHNNKLQIPAHWADPKVRAKRLRFIRRKLGFTVEEFSKILGTSIYTATSYELGRRQCTMAVLYVAEDYLRKWRMRNYAVRAKLPTGSIAELPFEVDPKQRLNVLRLHVAGVTNRDIASKLALRPEVVAFYLSNLDEQ